jgi:hypothetical protein
MYCGASLPDFSLDLDFADVLRFPPANTQGLMVLRPARVISISL